jgi:hypothetical protein
LLGVYAYADNFVRIIKTEPFSVGRKTGALPRARTQTEEFDNLKTYLAAERVDELPPFLSECEGECEGKRTFDARSARRSARLLARRRAQPKIFAGLERIFTEMREPAAKLHYWLEKSVRGLEILFETKICKPKQFGKRATISAC